MTIKKLAILSTQELVTMQDSCANTLQGHVECKKIMWNVPQIFNVE
jgi:hypothetical protein